MSLQHTSKRGRLRAIIALGSVLGIGAVVSLAAYSDNAQFKSDFSTGTLNIKVNDNEGNPNAYDFTLWSKDNLAAGKAHYALLTVNNAGTIDFDYSMKTAPVVTGDPDLLAITTVGAKVITGTTCDAAAYDGSSTVFVPEAAIGSAVSTADRTVANMTNENLCWKVLVTDATNDSQGKTIGATFKLDAESA